MPAASFLPTDPTQLAALLTQARTAYVALITGGQAVEVKLGTYEAKFSPANREALESFIAALQAQISNQPVRGAIGFVF